MECGFGCHAVTWPPVVHRLACAHYACALPTSRARSEWARSALRPVAPFGAAAAGDAAAGVASAPRPRMFGHCAATACYVMVHILL